MRVGRKPICLLLVALLLAVGGESKEPAHSIGKATIHGTVTEDYRGRTFTIGGLTVYLFTLQQSKSLRELEQRAYENVHQETDPQKVSVMVGNHIDLVANFVPTLARTAKTKTDRRGRYGFVNVSAGQCYHVVGLLVAEDGVRFLAGITSKLKPGERLQFDLRRGTSWEKRFKVEDCESQANQQ